MQILVITGCNLRYNFSAGLSHNAYIRGLNALNHDVDLLCCSEKDIEIDESIMLPQIRNLYEYDSISLYEKISQKKNKTKNQIAFDGHQTVSNSNTTTTLQGKVKGKLKRFIKKILYGSYDIFKVWYDNAKHFHSDVYYDCVISMSDPPISHRLAGYLINHNHVRCERWIQLLEDPWAEDLSSTEGYQEKKRLEGILLDTAQEIVYVSMVTLEHQKKLFPNNQNKMRWCPLASYYRLDMNNNSNKLSNKTNDYYGYFGDFSPNIRNIIPLYNVAVSEGIHLDICGSPSGLLKSQNNVNVHPRMPLDKLKEYEDRANIAVCLFNLGGGQIPGKIYQLAATNKIILAILDGPLDEQIVIKEFFEQFNRFVFCQNDELSISRAISEISKRQIGSIRNEPIDDFSEMKIAQRLLGE